MTESIGEDDEIGLDTLLATAKKEFGLKWSALKKKTWAPKERLEEWRSDAARGEQARAFLSGEFWRKHLEPFLRDEAKIKPWSPGAEIPSLESVATDYLWKSGRAFLLAALEKKISEWISEGLRAQELLSAENEKRKSLTPAR